MQMQRLCIQAEGNFRLGQLQARAGRRLRHTVDRHPCRTFVKTGAWVSRNCAALSVPVTGSAPPYIASRLSCRPPRRYRPRARAAAPRHPAPATSDAAERGRLARRSAQSLRPGPARCNTAPPWPVPEKAKPGRSGAGLGARSSCWKFSFTPHGGPADDAAPGKGVNRAPAPRRALALQRFAVWRTVDRAPDR